ncbi:TRAP transporter large permease [Xanthobacter dioxanivorans]|uniref:TRAP transporter large permease protein n=1 Tax=Xanthobacter dioxanivorans TaxID=2528964 RepID=A0A974PTF4_9HYPH|nr:TRAP transporter large permease [Xanthobacter dioxanivorans]QRG09094.1 TRAP transporter large permease [Xanthobacter dioxanivorans]
MGALVFGVLPLGLLGLGAPIFVVLLIATCAGMLFIGDIPLRAVHTAIFGSLDVFSLLAIPLFILAGDIMARGGIARRLIELILAMIGGVRGSMPMATVASAAAFGAMSGSSVACVAAIGKLTIPALEKGGYTRIFSVSLITATGVIDVIIPPSIPMIIYAIAAQQSASELFLAGIVPGLVVAAALAGYVYLHARWHNIAIGARPRWSQIRVAARGAIWAVLAPAIVLGGIYGGVFTPTEAAGVACVYAIVVSVFLYREMTLAQVWQVTLESCVLVAQIMIIVAAAGAYSWLITTSGFPARLVEGIASLQLETWMLLLAINLILLCVGSVLEPPAAILVMAPLLTPIAHQAGLNPLHFGIIVTVNLAVGMFMPPFGLNLFAAHAIFGTPLPRLYRGVVPFFVIYLMILMLLTYVPALTLAPMALYR